MGTCAKPWRCGLGAIPFSEVSDTGISSRLLEVGISPRLATGATRKTWCNRHIIALLYLTSRGTFRCIAYQTFVTSSLVNIRTGRAVPLVFKSHVCDTVRTTDRRRVITLRSMRARGGGEKAGLLHEGGVSVVCVTNGRVGTTDSLQTSHTLNCSSTLMFLQFARVEDGNKRYW